MALDKLKQLGNLKNLRQQAMQMQQQLAQEEISIDHKGVRIVISGDQKIKTLEVDQVAYPRILEAANEAIKRSQMMAAQKLAEMSKGGGFDA
ncbi:YbaB/EbfC family nucleoid-associated protein [Patescibacteria group bacterium]|nr:YbaB/EbfC family nucleoid-associated protein [Patescibacteria group bacterium]MBU1931616.1 YbaB/EbfC family nucleoid-associated protein [Patescibacteria group bacterium]